MTSDGALAFTHWKLEVFDQGMAQPPGVDDTLGGSPGRESATPASAAPASTDSQADSETPPAFKLPTADELEKLQAKYKAQGVLFYMLNSKDGRDAAAAGV